jgi:hypothetical protein
MYVVLAALACVGLAAWWLYYGTWTSGRHSLWPLALLPLILVTLVVVRPDSPRNAGTGSPVLVAIAWDVSLSMGTMPDPREHAGAVTRLERARHVLLPFLTELDSSTRPVMLAVTAFTTRSETVLAWDDEVPQIREVLQYVLTPGLLTESGSDIGAALEGTVPLFEALPEAWRDREYPKFLVLVSDGEQNVEEANAASALAKLRELGVKVIALQVGTRGVPEGLPVYDDAGGFLGFDDVGGQTFSVPDPERMATIAGRDPAEGLLVQAGQDDATGRMLEFIGVRIAGPESGPLQAGLLLLLWSLVVAVMFRYA